MFNHVLEAYEYIMEEAKCQPQSLDAETVSVLQGRCPARAKHDARFIAHEYDAGRIFARVDPARRLILRGQILSVPYLIPSFHTALENAKLLEVGAISLHGLLLDASLGRPKRSLASEFRARYETQGTVHVETDDSGSSRRQHFDDVEDAFEMAFRVIWLRALRHFPRLQALQPRIDPRPVSTPSAQDSADPDPLGARDDASRQQWQRDLALYATRAGFRVHLATQSDSALVESLVRIIQGWPLGRQIPRDDIVAEARRCCSSLEARARQAGSIIHPSQPGSRRSQPAPVGNSIRYRCGRPWNSSFEHDRRHLYYDDVFGGGLQLSGPFAEEHLTTQYCLSDTLRAFFCTSTQQTFYHQSRR